MFTKLIKKKTGAGVLALSTLFVGEGVAASTTIDMCVFDILGARGPAKELIDDYKVHSLRWGVDLRTQYYMDEREAQAAFEAGKCDLVNLPDFRAREYNKFTGTLNAVGAIPDYKHLETTIRSLSTPEAQGLMRNGSYEIFGISLVGGLHTFFTDRTVARPEGMEGKKISILEGVAESDYLNQQSGMIAVESDIGSIFNMFNDKQVDATVAPLIVYDGLEMHRGIEPAGGIHRYPFAMATMQLVARWEKFPESAGQRSREHVADSFGSIRRSIERYTVDIPDKYWIDLPLEDFYYWDNVFSRSRNELAKQGIYDQKMLNLLRKVRCKSYPDRAECLAL